MCDVSERISSGQLFFASINKKKNKTHKSIYDPNNTSVSTSKTNTAQVF